jgi:purine-cytosine permease-like protein
MNSSTLPTANHRAEALKERVYVTFTGLAVVLTLESHSETLTAGEAASTLTITVIGTLLAVFVADLVSHVAVHAKTPTRPELRHMARVSFGAFGAIVFPLIFMTLVLVGYLAVRRVSTSSP